MPVMESHGTMPQPLLYVLPDIGMVRYRVDKEIMYRFGSSIVECKTVMTPSYNLSYYDH